MAVEDLALADQLLAIQIPGRVTLYAQGKKPSVHHVVQFDQSPLLIFPPQYNLKQTPPDGIVAGPVMPFKTHIDLAVPADEKLESITVHDKAGKHAVRVIHVMDLLKIFPKQPNSENDLLSLNHTNGAQGFPVGVETLRGTSSSFSLEEALMSAVAQLPRDNNRPIDAQSTIGIVRMGAILGGIAGVRKLFVDILVPSSAESSEEQPFAEGADGGTGGIPSREGEAQGGGSGGLPGGF